MEILTIALLVLCGFVLLVIEAFLVPGFSVPGIAGICVIFFGVYRALGAFGPTGALVTFFCAAAGTAALVWVTLRTNAAKRAGLDESERGYTAPDDQTELLGREGVSITPLRPAGTALIGGARVDVVTDGEFLERETSVRVSAVEGTRVIVTRIREK